MNYFKVHLGLCLKENTRGLHKVNAKNLNETWKQDSFTTSDRNLLKIPVYFQNALSTGGIREDCAENLESSIL